jgi:hypothetical protein
MTLILSVNGPESIWMVADRRLTFEDQPPNDGATKIMMLEAQDGTAIIGYAGLGSTVRGTSRPIGWLTAYVA